MRVVRLRYRYRAVMAVLSTLYVTAVTGCGVLVPADHAQPPLPASNLSASSSTGPETTMPSAPPRLTAATDGTTSRTATSTPSAAGTSSRCAANSSGSPEPVPKRLSLVGHRGNAFAFAPLSKPADVTVEGQVSSSPAWSTAKVLVVAAYLATTTHGHPKRVSADNRVLITLALSRSDAVAVQTIRGQIPGRPGAAMTAILRAIGDTTTVAPDTYQGTMAWSIREQVRFMAALEAGRVVSPAASAYLLKTMRPIKAHSWGLGKIGATTFKGGWLRHDSPTRQMGIVGRYAVAISTDVGPSVVQTDGDAAHVREMNRLARILLERLTYDEACR
jgi:hypothetical protein